MQARVTVIKPTHGNRAIAGRILFRWKTILAVPEVQQALNSLLGESTRLSTTTGQK
jgi:hypothetical protein